MFIRLEEDLDHDLAKSGVTQQAGNIVTSTRRATDESKFLDKSIKVLHQPPQVYFVATCQKREPHTPERKSRLPRSRLLRGRSYEVCLSHLSGFSETAPLVMVMPRIIPQSCS